MRRRIAKIAFTVAAALAATGIALAQSSQPYLLTDPSNIELKTRLEQFSSLISKQQSSGTTSRVGTVMADVGCSISVATKNGSERVVFFEGRMTLDKKELVFEEITKAHSQLQRNLDSKHTFYVANQYLLAVEVTSFISDEGGENHHVIMRIAGPNGVLVEHGVQHCGC